jgi:hypothetical protein
MRAALVLLILTVILFVAAAMLPAFAGLFVVCGLCFAIVTALVAMANGGKGGDKSAG